VKLPSGALWEGTRFWVQDANAMAASGLTGGCATGSFRPDQPVTRGQLSVFLASALGLHFPN